ncbi:MAG: efflux RND transporter periplasmic adaptor subunit [Gemmatimonadota bacterium]
MTLKQRAPIALVVVLMAAAAWWFLRPRPDRNALSASGTVEATDAGLGFSVGGRIVDVVAHEGDSVHAGEVLAHLDSAEAFARVEQSRAQAAAARALLAELERGSRTEELEQARASNSAAERSVADARQDLDRMRRLAVDKIVSDQSVDKAQTAYDIARARSDQSGAELRLVEAGPRRERIAGQRAQVAMADAQVHSLEAAAANLTLHASFDGIVTVRHHEPGETVVPGAPVLTVMNPADRWVRIYIAENRVGAVRLGGPAEIRSDTWPDRRYRGMVTFIAHEAEFTPRNVQTSEERVKLVYAVKVRITSDSLFELKPGTPADVTLQ